MAESALALIQSKTQATTDLVLCEATGPGHVVGIDVDDTPEWIYRWATPLCATVEPREDHCLFAEAKGNKLSLAAERFELLGSPCMHFRSALCEHVRGQ